MWNDVRAAFSFLTILPLGYVQGRKPGWSFAWYPLVGLVIGGTLALIAAFSPFNASVTALLILLAWVIFTGGLHLDGFGDACDGLLATVEPSQRLAIMKDPRTGTWAVVGLILLLLGKWTTLATVPPTLLIVPPVAGRWAMVCAAYAYPYARQSGLGAYFREGLGGGQVASASAIALLTVILIARELLLVLIIVSVAVLAVTLIGRWAAHRLDGGLTGDVYGALCELTELLCLLGLSAWVKG
ncbi:MAG: adenosylcobinamide-GDP ribazoletransferase [Aggregatilineales bacterium]